MVPSGHKGLERKTAPQSLKRQVPPVRHLAAVPDLVPLPSPALSCAPAPLSTRQDRPARPRSPARQRPPAVPAIARQRSHAHTRPPAVPTTALKRSLTRQCSPVPQRTSGVKRAVAVPDTARKSSPAHQRTLTFQRAVQEVPKLAHGHSQVPLPSSKMRTPVSPNPVARPSQQRTPVRPHPDAPCVPVISCTPSAPPISSGGSSCTTCATLSCAPAHKFTFALSRGCAIAPSPRASDRRAPRPRARDISPAHVRPTVSSARALQQVPARPRTREQRIPLALAPIQPSNPPHVPAPARRTPSLSPMRARARTLAPALAQSSHARSRAGLIARPPARFAPRSPARSRTRLHGASGGQVIFSFPSSQAQNSALAGGGEVSGQV
ncbi:calphotin-like [Palaemon carinicauda]|uniref:calphotin-like n=1 Tax=Palaemon carinicauda TaxID=392227 RepID=UPI0035B5C6DC